MADSYTANLNLRKPEVGAAKDNWGNAPLGLNGDMDLIDAVFAPDGSGTSVGLHVGTGKILDAKDGTILATADALLMRDATDHTKTGRLLLSDLATATNNNYFLPPLADILVGQTQAQLLTNKTCPDAPTVIDNTQALASCHWVQAVISAVLAAIPPPVVAWDTGDIIASSAATKATWVQLVGGSIGDATSGATFADPTAQNLFNLFWAINGGTWPIVGGRGATALLDWQAHKRIVLPDARGQALIGTGGAINIATLFATAGAATHALDPKEMPYHKHGLAGNSYNTTGSPLGAQTGSVSNIQWINETLYTGGDPANGNATQAFSLVQPSMGVVYWIKL